MMQWRVSWSHTDVAECHGGQSQLQNGVLAPSTFVTRHQANYHSLFQRPCHEEGEILPLEIIFTVKILPVVDGILELSGLGNMMRLGEINTLRDLQQDVMLNCVQK
jgi:hypothetical protein